MTASMKGPIAVFGMTKRQDHLHIFESLQALHNKYDADALCTVYFLWVTMSNYGIASRD